MFSDDERATSSSCLADGTMSRFQRNSARRQSKRGATAVEVAFIMPVFLVFVFVLVEYGHMLWVNNMLSAASRNAARFGSTEGATNADVEQYIENFMRGTVDADVIEIQIKDGGVFDTDGEHPSSAQDYEDLPDIELNSAESRQLFVVRVNVNFGDAAFLPFPGVDQINLSSLSIMRHE